MARQQTWRELIEENPGHSTWYVERFRAMAEAGDDLAGEARMIDAMAPRNARILDAGCGPGRVGGLLALHGHEVVGVDLDPVLVAAAVEDWPGPTWLVGDLAEMDLPALGIEDAFDPAARVDVLRSLAGHLRADGRIAIGFGAGRGYAFDDFRSDVVAAGLAVDLELATWDLRPLTPDADFIVAILRVAD